MSTPTYTCDTGWACTLTDGDWQKWTRYRMMLRNNVLIMFSSEKKSNETVRNHNESIIYDVTAEGPWPGSSSPFIELWDGEGWTPSRPALLITCVLNMISLPAVLITDPVTQNSPFSPTCGLSHRQYLKLNGRKTSLLSVAANSWIIT